MSRWTKSAAPAPATSALPRWLTSNRPTASRTAVCSATVPAYETGISQPPKRGEGGAEVDVNGVDGSLQQLLVAHGRQR